MTSINKLTAAITLIISTICFSVYAQIRGPELNHFATEGISFDYLVGFTVADESTTEEQKLVITRNGSSVQLTIVALRRMIPPDELPGALDNFKETVIKNAGLTMGLLNSPAPTPIKTQLGSREAEGVRLQSSRTNNRTGEVIWLPWNSRLVALSFIRADADEAVGSRLWETVRSSLKVGGPVVIGAMPAETIPPKGAIMGGVLNGKALVLPKPAYPEFARAAHASGTVVVQVLISEEGDVISAKAISGHPLLQAASVAAAREAKFTPTRLGGMPVKVSGVIQYNFVAQ